MKCVILAGGLGTRLSEETDVRPKPMVEIGNHPIIWHIMKIYSSHGINDFIICCGYKGYVIKEYFYNYLLHKSDVTIQLKSDKIVYHRKSCENWNVTLVDTGLDSATGSRLKQVQNYIGDDEDFCFTYGDGVGNVNLSEQIKFHRRHNGIATVTGVQPTGRYGSLELGKDSKVTDFKEKPVIDTGWVNAGFFMLSSKVFDYIKNENEPWESTPMERLAVDGQLHMFPHRGFWHAMDTLRDKNHLTNLWKGRQAPWKVWND